MDWILRLNQAIDYIENNLKEEIDVNEAAKIAACTTFHFQRMFSYIAGVTLGEYIRKRRMTLAAFEMIQGEQKVIEIAAKYGYDSPTAFNRAFQGVHGIAPTAAKNQGVTLTVYPRITFSLSIKGDEAMNFRIETKESFRIVGYAMKGLMDMEDCVKKIPSFWQEVGAIGGIAQICSLIDGTEPQGILGVSTCENGEFNGYFIATATQKPCLEGMEEYFVPQGLWAIFDCVGPLPQAIQRLQQRIITEWLPTSGYEYDTAPDIEVYFEGDQSAADYRSQVWLPIVKK
ncbi:GyrI-like small molecule binding domain protein [anaerobic digester metagenome]